MWGAISRRHSPRDSFQGAGSCGDSFAKTFSRKQFPRAPKRDFLPDILQETVTRRQPPEETV